MTRAIFTPKTLDGRGRCCGRKPTVYKRPPASKFCGRCDRSYDPESGRQIENWAYQAQPDGTFLTSGYQFTDTRKVHWMGEPLAVLDDEEGWA